MNVLITGGTGSLGHALVDGMLQDDAVSRIAILSRDEWKQSVMEAEYGSHPKLRFFLGDVRDVGRLKQAFRGIGTVISAAALKRVDKVAYDPDEVIKTNVLGTMNVIEAAVYAGVPRVLLISSDKAVHPQNIYGTTKLAAEYVSVHANSWAHPQGTSIAAVRYGNVLGSRGSVVHLWKRQRDEGKPLTITHPEMTRFIITLPEAVDLVKRALSLMCGGEIFVPILPSAKMTDLAEAIAPGHPQEVVGLRAGGEKLHEQLLSDEEPQRTVVAKGLYIVKPSHPTWRADDPWKAFKGLAHDTLYISAVNDRWLSVEQLRERLDGLAAASLTRE